MYIVSTDTQNKRFNIENDLRVIYSIQFIDWSDSPIHGQNRMLLELLLNLCIVSNKAGLESTDVLSLCANLSRLLDEMVQVALDNMKNC